MRCQLTMIVPRPRLLWWFALIAIPAAAIFAIEPAAAIAIVAAIFAVMAIDAVLALGNTAGIRVQLPEIVRLVRDRAGSIDVLITSNSARNLRIALPLPRRAFPDTEPRDFRTNGTGAMERFEWPCKPSQRGAWRISECWIEIASLLGFWDLRFAAPVHTEIRSYPNLAAEHRQMAARIAQQGGVHVTRQVGRGREFDKVREYIHGDSLDEIHWKATARRLTPVTKIFQVERTQEVYVAIDASRLSARDAGHDTVIEQYITAGLILGGSAQRSGDLFGLTTFSDQVHEFVRARNGREHYGACRDAVLRLESRPVMPDFNELMTFIRLRLRRRAMIVFLTALDDPATSDAFLEVIGLISGQHLVQVTMIEPDGAGPLFKGPPVENTEAIYDHLAGHLRWHKLRDTARALQRRGVRFSMAPPGQLALTLTTEYLQVKRRQLI